MLPEKKDLASRGFPGVADSAVRSDPSRSLLPHAGHRRIAKSRDGSGPVMIFRGITSRLFMAASEEVQGQLEPAMAQSESRSGLLLRFSRIDGVC
jgi:hypothetical protein